MKANVFLQELATKSGLKAEDISEISEALELVEIPDNVVDTIKGKMISIDTAKNHPDVIKHIKALALNGLDTKISEVSSELKIPEEVLSQISDEKNSYTRVEKLIKALHEMKKADPSPKEDKELTSKINELNEQLNEYKNNYVPKSQLEEVQNSHKSQLTDFYMNSVLSEYEFATPIAKEEGYLLPKTKIQKALKDKELTLSLVDGRLEILTKEGTKPINEKNEFLDTKGFVDSVLSSAELLKKSGGNEPAPTPTPTPTYVQQGNGLDTSLFQSKLNEMKQSLNI